MGTLKKAFYLIIGSPRFSRQTPPNLPLDCVSEKSMSFFSLHWLVVVYMISDGFQVFIFLLVQILPHYSEFLMSGEGSS